MVICDICIAMMQRKMTLEQLAETDFPKNYRDKFLDNAILDDYYLSNILRTVDEHFFGHHGEYWRNKTYYTKKNYAGVGAESYFFTTCNAMEDLD